MPVIRRGQVDRDGDRRRRGRRADHGDAGLDGAAAVVREQLGDPVGRGLADGRVDAALVALARLGGELVAPAGAEHRDRVPVGGLDQTRAWWSRTSPWSRRPSRRRARSAGVVGDDEADVVLNRRERAPLRADRALWWPRPLDVDTLHASASQLLGEHDFRAFTPTETQHESFRREILDAGWERRDEELHFTVTADSFLRHMVRTLVGTMLEAPESIPSLLDGRPRSEAGMTAPPGGLYLEHVEY